jgi:acetyl esterase
MTQDSESLKLDSNLTSSVDLLSDPHFKAFIDKFNAYEKSISRFSLPEQRKLNTEFFIKENKVYEHVNRIENLEIQGIDNNTIPLRIYIPTESKKLPVMMYFHGGGWVFGGIEESDAVCRRLANHLDCMIVSVEYRLAPEFAFPKPLEDCYCYKMDVAKCVPFWRRQ